MVCLNPIVGYGEVNEYGFIDTQLRFDKQIGQKIYCPCRYCLGCAYQARALRTLLFKMQWSQALAKGQPSSFITLTYNNQYLPPSGLAYRDIQQFMHSFKRMIRREGYTDELGYIYAGEEGLLNKRPHFHICLVGVSPLDFDYVCHKIGKYESSPAVDRLWGKGFNTVCEASVHTICYTAGYTCKKLVLHSDIDYRKVVQSAVAKRRREAGFNGLMSVDSDIAFFHAISNNKTVEEYVEAFNADCRAKVPEFIKWRGRLIENPRFPKGRCYQDGDNFRALERVVASRNLGQEYFDRYCRDTITGFMHDPVEINKICAIPPKFIKQLADIDFSRYVKIKREKAHFAAMNSRDVEELQNYYNSNKNALISRLKGGSIRELDLQPLDPDVEDEIEKNCE